MTEQSITELKSIMRMHKEMGRTKMPVAICTVEKLIKEIESAKGPMALEAEAEAFLIRKRMGL